MREAYKLAQEGMANLRSAVHMMLVQAPEAGVSNAEIGRSLGIYSGHIGHEGHISRTILALMESEGVVEQDKVTKAWRIRLNID